MYCGNCFRDNALVAELRKLGHHATMLPMYLPITLDENDQSAGQPIFFNGINVYLAQKSAMFRRAPKWLRKFFVSPKLLNFAGKFAAKTNPRDVGELLISMLRGEEGKQARELDELIAWLKRHEKPDVICLSNALLLGLARRLKAELRTTVVCTLQGEDSFLDALPASHRDLAWKTISERARDADLFIAPSNYFAELIGRRLKIPPEKIKVVHNGIELDGYTETRNADHRTWNEIAVGYFARMCKEKGLDTLVEAFILLKRNGHAGNLKLRIGGSCGPADEPFVKSLRQRLAAANCLGEVEFCPNLSRDEKIDFLKSLTVFSVPALYGEAFGLYLIEAMAAGVPVVQPRTAAFPELIEATGGGILCEPGDVNSLADGIEALLSNPSKARALGEAGRKSVFEKFTAERMAQSFLQACSGLANRPA